MPEPRPPVPRHKLHRVNQVQQLQHPPRDQHKSLIRVVCPLGPAAGRRLLFLRPHLETVPQLLEEHLQQPVHEALRVVQRRQRHTVAHRAADGRLDDVSPHNEPGPLGKRLLESMVQEAQKLEGVGPNRDQLVQGERRDGPLRAPHRRRRRR